MRVSLIVNLRSSGTQRRLAELPGLFRAHGIDLVTTIAVDDRSALEGRVRRLADDRAEAIVVAGGDGSMTLAANALAHRKTVLGVLPLGTGNSFAQTLGIGSDLESALQTIAGGRVARVDLGLVNKRYFANFAVIGLTAEMAANTPHNLKPLFGPFAYVAGALGPLLHARAFRAKIRWPDGRLKLRTAQMVIASGRFFGKTPVLPDASVTDGKLAFFTTDGVSRFDLARMYVAFGLGLQTKLPDAHTFSARKLRVTTKRKEPIGIDGNPGGTTPATFRIAKRALRVFVPASFDAAAP